MLELEENREITQPRRDGLPSGRLVEIHVGLIWPFFRASVACPKISEILKAEGIDLHYCVRPDARIPYGATIRALAAYVEATGDTTVGLRAGEHVESGDFGVPEAAASFSGTLLEALSCAGRYAPLLCDSAELSLVQSGDTALWCFRLRNVEETPDHFAADDFVVSAGMSLLRRYVRFDMVPREVHLRHRLPPDAGLYRRRFRAKVKFGAACNGIVLDRSQLDLPMLRADPALYAAYDAYARELQGPRPSGLRPQVAALVADGVRAGNVSMERVAQQLGASSATLRRRLESEGTTFREVVNEVRRVLAERYMLDRGLSISEIGFALGFSSVGAFCRAFQRWFNQTPSEYRARVFDRRPRSG